MREPQAEGASIKTRSPPRPVLDLKEADVKLDKNRRIRTRQSAGGQSGESRVLGSLSPRSAMPSGNFLPSPLEGRGF